MKRPANQAFEGDYDTDPDTSSDPNIEVRRTKRVTSQTTHNDLRANLDPIRNGEDFHQKQKSMLCDTQLSMTQMRIDFHLKCQNDDFKKWNKLEVVYGLYESEANRIIRVLEICQKEMASVIRSSSTSGNISSPGFSDSPHSIKEA